MRAAMIASLFPSRWNRRPHVRKKLISGLRISDWLTFFSFSYMAKSYSKKISGFLHRGPKMSLGQMKGKHDNPHIRHSRNENKLINLNEEWEVRYAEKVGAVKISEDGGVEPVKGKSYVKNNHLYYVNPPGEHVVHKTAPKVSAPEPAPLRKPSKTKTGRSISEDDRKVWGQDALKGTQKWHLMTHKERVERRAHPKSKWGFEGKSPNTVDRR